MALLLALVIALPPVLLLLGLVLGASGAWWWWVRRSRQHGPLSLCDSSQAAAAAAAAMADVLEAADPSATSTDQRASKGGELALLPPGIHIVASCASLKPSSRSAHSSNSFLPLGPRLAVPSQPSAARQPAAGTGLHCPAALQAPRSPDVHVRLQRSSPTSQAAATVPAQSVVSRIACCGRLGAVTVRPHPWTWGSSCEGGLLY